MRLLDYCSEGRHSGDRQGIRAEKFGVCNHTVQQWVVPTVTVVHMVNSSLK